MRQCVSLQQKSRTQNEIFNDFTQHGLLYVLLNFHTKTKVYCPTNMLEKNNTRSSLWCRGSVHDLHKRVHRRARYTVDVGFGPLVIYYCHYYFIFITTITTIIIFINISSSSLYKVFCERVARFEIWWEQNNI